MDELASHWMKNQKERKKERNNNNIQAQPEKPFNIWLGFDIISLLK